MTSQLRLSSNRLLQAELSAHLTKLAPAWQAVLGADEVKCALDRLSAMLAQRSFILHNLFERLSR